MKEEMLEILKNLNRGRISVSEAQKMLLELYDNNILKTLIDYNEYLFTLIDKDNVGIEVEKEDVIDWYYNILSK